MMKCKSSWLVPISAILACFLWSTAYLGVKVGLRYAQPFSFAGMRFMLAGLLLLPLWWNKRPSLAEVWQHRNTILIISLFQTFLLYSFFYTGMTIVEGALAAIVVGATPLVSAIMAHFWMRGDRMTLSKTLSLFVGMGGVVVISISRQPWSAGGFVEFLGILCLLGAIVAGTTGNIFVAKRQYSLHPICLTSIQIFLGGFALFLVSLVIEGPPRFRYPGEFYVALVWLAFVSATAFSLWFTMLRRPGVKISELNLWKFVTPVSGAILSWTFLPNESPSFWPLLGMVLIAASIVGFNLSTLRQRQASQQKKNI